MKRFRLNPQSTVERSTQKGYSLFDVLASKPVPANHSTAVITGIRSDVSKAEEFLSASFFDDDALPESSVYTSNWKAAAFSGVLLALIAATGSYVLVNPHLSHSGLATLAKAEATLHAGDLPTAVHLVESISPKSRVYQEAQVAISQWPVAWQRAEMLLNSIEIAFVEKRWRDVLTYAHQMPDIEIWQRRLNPIVSQALDYLNAEARQQLEIADAQAREQQFSRAIAELQQIPVDAQVYDLAQRHIAEYAKKREIRAQYLLQRADYQAAVKNFANAVDYLQQIPSGSSVSDLAQQKILEYTARHRLEPINPAKEPRLLPAPGEPGELSRFENIFSNRPFTPSLDMAKDPAKAPRLLPAPGEPGELSRFETIFSNQPLLKSTPIAGQPEVDIHIPKTGNINPGDQLQEITPRFITHSF